MSPGEADEEPGHESAAGQRFGTQNSATDAKTMWDQRYAAAELVWSATPNRLLEAVVVNLPAGRALDLGCGEGRNSIWLATQGWRVTGVDFSRVGIEKAQRIAAERKVEIEWIVDDLASFVPKPCSFDLVVVLFIHLTWSTMSEMLQRASSSLVAGGTLLVIGHDSSNMNEGIGGPQNPEVLYTANDITSALPDMKVARAERVFRQVSGEDRPAIDVLVHLQAP